MSFVLHLVLFCHGFYLIDGHQCLTWQMQIKIVLGLRETIWFFSVFCCKWIMFIYAYFWLTQTLHFLCLQKRVDRTAIRRLRIFSRVNWRRILSSKPFALFALSHESFQLFASGVDIDTEWWFHPLGFGKRFSSAGYEIRSRLQSKRLKSVCFKINGLTVEFVCMKSIINYYYCWMYLFWLPEIHHFYSCHLALL